MNRETIKQQKNKFTKIKVGNQVCDIEEHHRAITKRANTVSHHRLVVWQ